MYQWKKDGTDKFVEYTAMPLAYYEFPRIFLEHTNSLRLIRLNDGAPWREDLGMMVAAAMKYTIRHVHIKGSLLEVKLNSTSYRNAQLPKSLPELNNFRVPLPEYACLYAEILRELQTAKRYSIVKVGAPPGLVKLLTPHFRGQPLAERVA
ncbi:MAG TPA: hypothetical protein HA224_00155 [Nanoarchaeota archaeon]|nr:hypothetical protein [Nanoarchaeota archaeon]